MFAAVEYEDHADRTPAPSPTPTAPPAPPAPPVTRTVRALHADAAVRISGDQDRLRAVIFGEADLSAAPTLEAVLLDAARRTAALEVDLGHVAFIDCSGLNCLLRARAVALAHGATLTVTDTTPAARRLLSLTGTLHLFTAHPAASAPSPPTTAPPARAAN
jgi:anti-anti-sigma factor